MSEAKHTAGPWHVEPQEDGCSWEICTEKRGAWIMLLRSTAEATDEERSEDLANATLMAAAPELLEELMRLVDSLSAQDEEGLIEHAEPFIAARAAIAKATRLAS